MQRLQRIQRSSWTHLLASVLALTLVLGGCSSLSNTQKGAIIGAGTGGAAGAAVGKAAGGTAEGAILGAVIGGTAGAVIGERMDNKAEELDQELENAEVERVGEGIKVTFDSGILFDFDSADLRSEARANLREFAASMQEYPETKILIVGHTDSKGPADYNMTLSENRAQSASSFLRSQGLASDRLRTVGRGETEPVASNDTEEGRQQNRRVEVAIYASEEYREEVQERVESGR
jgi:outer membrane protein OmpA-like peptidoglycan-associated protein